MSGALENGRVLFCDGTMELNCAQSYRLLTDTLIKQDMIRYDSLNGLYTRDD